MILNPATLCKLLRLGEMIYATGGLAVMLEVAFAHPRDCKVIEIRQAVRIRRDEPFTLHAGERADLVCWGVMPSGLRHPLFVRWLASGTSRAAR